MDCFVTYAPRNDAESTEPSNPLELQSRQPCIKPVRRDQRSMRALFDDAALVHHHDAVARQYRREPVRDHKRGAVTHQFFQRGLYQRLAFGVECGGCLIEQQQRRIAQDGARNGDALALATGQRHAALA